MRPTLYVETNFVLSIAKGQDPKAIDLLYDADPEVTIVFPGFCFMEAFSVLTSERKYWGKFRADLKRRAGELKRDRVSLTSSKLATALDQSSLDGDDLLNELEVRTYDVLGKIIEDAEIIPCDSSIIDDSLKNDYTEDPADNLILCSILWHARRNPDGLHAFASGNTSDFGTGPVKAVLEGARVSFFGTPVDAVGWLLSTGPAGPVQP